MKNFVQPGNQITVAAPAAIASGEGVQIGDLFGVANGDAAIGADLVLSTVGVDGLESPRHPSPQMERAAPLCDAHVALLDAPVQHFVQHHVQQIKRIFGATAPLWEIFAIFSMV